MEYLAPDQSLILRDPGLDAYSASFSPDGDRIVTTSHTTRIPGMPSERTEYAAKIWSNLQPIRDLDDLVLWTTTTYCPSVKKRMKLLSLPEDIATRQYKRCLAKVAVARAFAASHAR